jgi:hypothetical protein
MEFWIFDECYQSLQKYVDENRSDEDRPMSGVINAFSNAILAIMKRQSKIVRDINLGAPLLEFENY